jgi:hypothetical protein
VITKEELSAATRRLSARFGNSASTGKPQRGGLLPRESDLIDSVIAAANEGSPTLDTRDIKAALTLLPALRWAVNNRERKLIKVARDSGIVWREIAARLGMYSPQAAQQSYARLDEQSPPRIYAFRLADDDAPWHGDPDCLPYGGYEFAVIDFAPAPHVNSPFSGKMLEIRYGDVPDDHMPRYLRGFPIVDGRRIGFTETVQQALFNY